MEEGDGLGWKWWGGAEEDHLETLENWGNIPLVYFHKGPTLFVFSTSLADSLWTGLEGGGEGSWSQSTANTSPLAWIIHAVESVSPKSSRKPGARLCSKRMPPWRGEEGREAPAIPSDGALEHEPEVRADVRDPRGPLLEGLRGFGLPGPAAVAAAAVCVCVFLCENATSVGVAFLVELKLPFRVPPVEPIPSFFFNHNNTDSLQIIKDLIINNLREIQFLYRCPHKTPLKTPALTIRAF